MDKDTTPSLDNKPEGDAPKESVLDLDAKNTNPTPAGDATPQDDLPRAGEPKPEMTADSLVEIEAEPDTEKFSDPTQEENPFASQELSEDKESDSDSSNEQRTSSSNSSRSQSDRRQSSEKRPKREKKEKKPKKQKQPKQKAAKASNGKDSGKSRSVLLTILIVLIVLAGIAAALWYFYFQPEKDTTDSDDAALQTTQDEDQPTAANSAALMIETIQEALHEDMDELYEDLSIEPSTPQSENALVSPAYMVSDADYAVTTTLTHSLAVTRTDADIKLDKEFTDRVEKVSVGELKEAGYKKTKPPVGNNKVHQTDDVTCEIRQDESLDIVCVDHESFDSVSSDAAPFVEAIKSSSSKKAPSIKKVAFGKAHVSDGDSEGYQVANLTASGETLLFFKQPDAEWTFFTRTDKETLSCDEYSSEASQKAFANTPCVDPESPNTKPLMVSDYVERQG